MILIAEPNVVVGFACCCSSANMSLLVALGTSAAYGVSIVSWCVLPWLCLARPSYFRVRHNRIDAAPCECVQYGLLDVLRAAGRAPKVHTGGMTNGACGLWL